MTNGPLINSAKLHKPRSTGETEHPVDRPGFDLGGSSGETTAGLGLGLGDDSSDTRLERSLPGRRMGATLHIPRWIGPDPAEPILPKRD